MSTPQEADSNQYNSVKKLVEHLTNSGKIVRIRTRRLVTPPISSNVETPDCKENSGTCMLSGPKSQSLAQASFCNQPPQAIVRGWDKQQTLLLKAYLNTYVMVSDLVRVGDLGFGQPGNLRGVGVILHSNSFCIPDKNRCRKRKMDVYVFSTQQWAEQYYRSDPSNSVCHTVVGWKGLPTLFIIMKEVQCES